MIFLKIMKSYFIGQVKLLFLFFLCKISSYWYIYFLIIYVFFLFNHYILNQFAIKRNNTKNGVLTNLVSSKVGYYIHTTCVCVKLFQKTRK